jgi:uncharacterized protein YkwD
MMIERRIRLLLLLLGTLCTLLAAAPATAQRDIQPASSSSIYLPVISAASVISPPEQLMVDLTNQLRQQHGCAPLNLSPQLIAATRAHSEDMAAHDYFGHIDLAGHDPAWRDQQAGYPGIAGWENIAAGFGDAALVVTTWYNETPPHDGHRRNMLNCALTDIGVGFSYNGNSTYGSYWTQDFGQQ